MLVQMLDQCRHVDITFPIYSRSAPPQDSLIHLLHFYYLELMPHFCGTTGALTVSMHWRRRLNPQNLSNIWNVVLSQDATGYQ